MKKVILGFVISFVFIYFLFSKIDLSEFSKLKESFNFYYIIPVLLSNFFSFLVFAYRWYLLVNKNISFKTALNSTVIGGGGNLILPARGGDLFRVYFTKKESTNQYSFLISKIFKEKVIDFVVVIVIGFFSYMILVKNQSSSVTYSLFGMSFLLLLTILIGCLLLRFQNERINLIIFHIAKFVKLEKFYEHNIKNQITEFKEFLSINNISKQAVISFFLWIFSYTLNYYLLQNMIGIQLSYTETLFLVFCGAMGLMIPSAPSGAGVFHASITSGFVLLGRKSSEGLVYATIVHLIQFLVIGFFALIFYLNWTISKRKKI